MADLKTTNIYGDAYINNKVGINTNTPATRLQIGQLSPTAATEGIQFGDDTSARLHRINSGHIRATGGISSATFLIADNYLQTNNNLIYPASQTATQRLAVGNASGNAWIDGITIAQGGNVTVYNNLTATNGYVYAGTYLQAGNNNIYPSGQTSTLVLNVGNASGNNWINGIAIAQGGNVTIANNLTVNNNATVTNDLTVNGNTYLGNANNDTVYVNDTIRIGATDSGDASLFFGEGSVAGSDYGARWYWDSGYTFTWYTRNAGTDTALFDYVTNDLNYINWRRHFHMQNKEINYSSQVHFNAGTRFVGNNTEHLIFRSDSNGVGGIQVQSGDTTLKGYIGYWDSGGGGILNNTGNWSVRYNFGSANSGGTLYGAWTVNGNISATNLSGTNTGDQTVGNGTITIAAGTGVGVGTTNTFTTNQSGATTVTISNSGVTSNVAGTGISVSGATGAVTITNSGVTSLAGTTNRITVSGATGGVTLNLPQDIHTGASPTFAGLSLTSVSTTGATITNLTGAYQNTTVYDSPKTQSATPSRGIRAPASSIQFTDSYAIAPFWTFRSTGDWPVPYGIGWGTGGESSGIFQRYASNGSSFGDMIFYTGNDGSGAFSFRRHTWEGTTHFAAGSGELNTELFRIDWSGNLTMLGTLNGSANSATFFANNGSYGAWAINGTRNGWGGIEFANNGVSLMMGSDTVGFHQNTNGWLFRVHNGSGFIYKGAWGGGTAATILDSSNASYAWNMNQNVRTTDNPTFGTLQLTRLNFGASAAAPYAAASGEGYGNGITFGGDENSAAYRIFTGMENIGGNYSKLTFNWHTGIRIGAYYGYGGIRFYDNYVGAGTKVFSIAEGDSNVRVYNELIVQGSGINGAYGFMKYGGTRSGDWQLFTTSSAGAGQMNVVQVENIGGGGHSNYPTGVYTYGGVMSWRLPNHSFQLYAAHTGDLAYKTQWNNDNYSGWRRILDSTNYPYAANMNQYVRTTDNPTFGTVTAALSGNATTATTLQTARNINGVSFNGSAAITVNGLNYNVNNDWLRENGDDDQFKLYGNSRTMIYRTDGNTNAHGGGAFAHIFYYGGSADANRMFIINTDGRLWSTYHGWLDTMSISGNAATATTLQTARNINGTSFNGSAAITTATWGTARTITIGSTGKSVDGSANVSWTLAEIGAAATNQTMFIGTTSVAINRASAAISLAGTSIDGTAGGLNSSNYINRCGSSGNANTDFQNTPAGTVRHNGDDANLTNSPGGTWWFYDNYRHSNASNYWGIQVAWGWEDNANKLATRNITGNSFGGWVYYLNSGNYTDYTVTKTGTGASGNWAINVTGNAATVTNGIYTTSYHTGTPLGKRRYRIHTADSTSLNSSITSLECGFTYGGSGEPTGPFIAFGGLGGAIDYSCQLVGAYSGGGNDFKIRTRNDDTAAWNTWRTIITDGNYTSYSPTLTGTGASGTWAINITGNAATATTATNVTIANGSVTLAKIENITAYTILGNSNASAAATPAALSVATVATMLSGQTMNINGSSTSCSGTATNATTAGGLAVHTGTNNEANKIVRTEGNGYIMAGWINTISGDNGTTAIDRVYASSDGYIRYYTPANFRTVLDVPTRAGSGASGNWAINVTGNAATATNVAASGITGQTGMWTSATRPGPYRLYRNDHDSAYNLQLTWQAHRTNYWSLRGYLNDTFHAECFVVYSGYADEAGALTIGNTYRVANLGINVAASNRLHINGDGTNPTIRIDNGALVTGVASNSKNTFQGYLPVSFGGTTYYIRLWT